MLNVRATAQHHTIQLRILYTPHAFTMREHWYLCLDRCVATVRCKSARHRLTASPQQLHTDNRWVWRLPSGHKMAVRCLQVITADAVIAHITHDNWPNISPASGRNGAKRRGGLSFQIACVHGSCGHPCVQE